MTGSMVVVVAVVGVVGCSVVVAIRQLKSIRRSRQQYEDRVHGLDEPYRDHELAALHPDEVVVEKAAPLHVRGYPTAAVFATLEAPYQATYLERLRSRREEVRAWQAVGSAGSAALFGSFVIPVTTWAIPLLGEAFSGDTDDVLWAIVAEFGLLGLLITAIGPYGAVLIGRSFDRRLRRLRAAYREAC